MSLRDAGLLRSQKFHLDEFSTLKLIYDDSAGGSSENDKVEYLCHGSFVPQPFDALLVNPACCLGTLHSRNKPKFN